MSYVPRPDAAGDTLSKSRNPIRTNFIILEDRFNENHVDLDGGAGGGKHSFLQMPEQAAAPTTAANEAGFYTAVANTVSQLFMRRESDGASLQLTASDVTDATAQATSGYSCLPGGLLIQYGSIGSQTTSSTRTIIFPRTFNIKPYAVVMSPFKSGNVSTMDSYVQTTSSSQFTIRVGTAHSWDFFWIAIGQA